MWGGGGEGVYIKLGDRRSSEMATYVELYINIIDDIYCEEERFQLSQHLLT